jgi:hypothetical protein
MRDVYLGHRLDKPDLEGGADTTLDAHIAEWSRELKKIGRRLKTTSKSLDVVTFPSSVLGPMLVDTPTSSTVLVSEEQMEKTESFLSKLRNLAASHLGGNVRLGIDFQSEHLYNLSPQVLEAYMSLLNGIIQRKRISASELDSVLVATNCLTLKQSPVIIGVASALGLPTFSTEVLRSDHRRPGLLTDIAKEIQADKAFERLSARSSDKSAAFDNDNPELQMTNAAKQLNVALNNCIYLEDGFAQKVF